jgi:hypothetical protein
LICLQRKKAGMIARSGFHHSKLAIDQTMANKRPKEYVTMRDAEFQRRKRRAPRGFLLKKNMPAVTTASDNRRVVITFQRGSPARNERTATAAITK